MRVDKYLWSVRYFKSRSLATQACKKGAVRVNGSIIKASREVYPSDKIVVRKNQINYELEILDLPKSRLGAKLVDLFRKDITPKEAFANTELLKYAKDHYRKRGTGRPSKKDRRDIDGFTNPDAEEE
ncbi:MAG: RNA-binding S4 domain-containing protein [Flavobacteriaceae bacterium]|nr:RNA-binding S4 domain-containing protein [Flavobacteriaceae bacterium]